MRKKFAINTKPERCHPRQGREAAVGDPEKTSIETGAPAFSRGEQSFDSKSVYI